MTHGNSEIINVHCFKLLSFGADCYVAMENSTDLTRKKGQDELKNHEKGKDVYIEDHRKHSNFYFFR